MEQYPLISLGDLQSVTHFFSGPAVNVAHREDESLRLRKQVDGAADGIHGFTAQELRFGIGVPWAWRNCPVIGVTVIAGAESRRINGGF